ncbi:MAG: hypothetical protein JNK00_12990 [Flavipsychrobacter sp.]|nr:hypothetical protein [Flavipsychrobacter sp.]
MQKAVILITIVALGYFLIPVNKANQYKVEYEANKTMRPPLRLVFFHDISNSTKGKGVQKIEDSTFVQLYQAYDRNIELDFGIIAKTSARQLVPLYLPAWTLAKPIVPELLKFEITQREGISTEYREAINKYKADSQLYCINRRTAITKFTARINKYLALEGNSALRSGTDIETALAIADKTFNYSSADKFNNVCILNSDGRDSEAPSGLHLINKATVILVNANKFEKTSIDSLVTHKFQSIEQAISFILTK